MAKYKHFTDEETEGLNENFVKKLDQARDIAGIPFQITSGLRSLEKNQSLPGAAGTSSHLTGLAVDLRVENDHEVYLIIHACEEVGITRAGIYVDAGNAPTHVHVDCDDTKVPEVIWIKREGHANSAPVTV